MDNSNSKHEPVDDQPNINEITKYEPGFIQEIKNVARFHPPPPLSPPHPPPAAAAGPSLPPPLPSLRPSRPLPVHERLPPRTTRADFITPDQRAIFGPVVQPFERADMVKPDGL